jgi:predicted PurR-regulated permease PerM
MRKILTLVIVIILGAIAFFYLGGSGSNNTGSLVAQVQSTQSSEARDISNLLQKMYAVDLDDSIFSKLNSFKDNTITLSQQISGRSNPFAPLGSVSVGPSSQQPGAPIKLK